MARFIVTCLLLLGIFFTTGCAFQLSGSRVMDYEYLVNDLRLSRVTIEEIMDVPYPVFDAHGESVFSVGGKSVRIEDEKHLLVLEYENEAAVKTEAGFVSRDGYDLHKPEGKFYQSIDWIAPPHWYQDGRIIVLYVGENPEIRILLEDLLGRQFAGQGPARSIE